MEALLETIKPAGKSGAKRRASAATPLSRERIVEAALAQIDQEGLENFSLRNLANRLGVYPTAIYWYVPNRNELLAQVVALIFDKVAPAKRRRAWQTYLRDLFGNFRDAIRAHPNMAPLVGAQLVSNTSMSLAFVEDLLAALSRAGLSGPPLLGAFNTVVAALVGFTAQEFAPMPTEDPVGWQMTVQQRLIGIDREQYPVLAANLSLLSNRAFIVRWQNGVDAPLDDSFVIYVDVMIAGIERLIERAAVT
ncbi:hypothetical protein BH10PSE3_BH10PSE3_34640 [soil metagenome]